MLWSTRHCLSGGRWSNETEGVGGLSLPLWRVTASERLGTERAPCAGSGHPAARRTPRFSPGLSYFQPGSPPAAQGARRFSPRCGRSLSSSHGGDRNPAAVPDTRGHGTERPRRCWQATGQPHRWGSTCASACLEGNCRLGFQLPR